MTTDPAVRRAVIERDQGRCVRCGSPGTDVHHRSPRGMGGSHILDRPDVCLLLCRSCHNWVESRRDEAFACGLLVHRGTDPATVPVRLGRRILLFHPDGWVAEVRSP